EATRAAEAGRLRIDVPGAVEVVIRAAEEQRLARRVERAAIHGGCVLMREIREVREVRAPVKPESGLAQRRVALRFALQMLTLGQVGVEAGLELVGAAPLHHTRARGRLEDLVAVWHGRPPRDEQP